MRMIRVSGKSAIEYSERKTSHDHTSFAAVRFRTANNRGTDLASVATIGHQQAGITLRRCERSRCRGPPGFAPDRKPVGETARGTRTHFVRVPLGSTMVRLSYIDETGLSWGRGRAGAAFSCSRFTAGPDLTGVANGSQGIWSRVF